jgi:hypothetical protein
VMVVRAGFNPAGVDGIRPWVSAGHSGCLSQESPGFIRGEVSKSSPFDREACAVSGIHGVLEL